jgi:BirA family biotin operon repressor/biotin-[acetyl-CoA-carboxylase] ligase
MPIGTPFIELQSVDSTNNYALARIHEGLAQHGCCFFAYEQTAGRGQMGKSWATGSHSNIALSIVFNPFFLQAFQQFWLSACVAVATHQFFSKYAGEDTKIKWPNDLYWQDRKAGGILIENIIGPSAGEGISARSTAQDPFPSQWKWSVVGIGININQTKFPGHLTNPVSLKQISGKDHNVLSLAKELCGSIDRFYKKLMNEGVEPILELYNEFLYKKDETVRLKKDNRIFETTIKATDGTGQLITRHAIEERFDFGEIEWLI